MPIAKEHIEAADKLWDQILEMGDADHRERGDVGDFVRRVFSAALAAAVRVARQEVWDYVEKSNPATIREAVRVAVEKENQRWLGIVAEAYDGGRRAIEAPPTPAPAHHCGLMGFNPMLGDAPCPACAQQSGTPPETKERG